MCVGFWWQFRLYYYQNKNFLNISKHLERCIVEQPKFGKCGNEDFEDRELVLNYDKNAYLSRFILKAI